MAGTVLGLTGEEEGVAGSGQDLAPSQVTPKETARHEGERVLTAGDKFPGGPGVARAFPHGHADERALVDRMELDDSDPSPRQVSVEKGLKGVVGLKARPAFF